MLDRPEMQCSCNHKAHLFGERMGRDFRCCNNMIPYLHHHDWSEESDYKCEDCVTNHKELQ